MEIYHLEGKKDEDGLFPIPKNLGNRDMFCYPVHIKKTGHLSNVDKIVNNFNMESIRLINAIVYHIGQKYSQVKWAWSINFMGYDSFGVIPPDGIKSYDVYYRNYRYEHGFLIIYKNEADWEKNKHKVEICKRNIKLKKIISKIK